MTLRSTLTRRRYDPQGPMRTIGPYSVLEELGRGGQGVVYLAEDTRLNRKVALKVIETVGQDMPSDRLERFRREAEAASRLDHPNICGIHEAGEADGVPYIAMRYVEGETLADQIGAARDKHDSGTDSTPSTREHIHAVLHRIEKVARALHVAHELGLIHRDIKPGNIMLTGDEEPVVLDFGLARDEFSDGDLSLTVSGDLLGTPAYMSPEQLMAQRIPLDRRTDIYSLGATLYECLTLRRPFEALTRAELYQSILTDQPASATSMNRAIPRDLQVVIETALEKNRDRRYQTALDFAEDLRRVREYEPIRAKPIGRLLLLKRWTQRHPVATVIVSALVVALGGTVSFLLDRQAALRGTQALALASASAQAGEKDQMLSLLLATAAVDRDRTPATLTQLHRALSEAHERAVHRHPGPVTSIMVCPANEDLVLSTCADRVARLWDLPLGKVIATYPDCLRATFSPDGSLIAISRPNKAVVALTNRATGRVVRLLKGHGGVRSLDFDHDGKRLVTGGAENTRIWDTNTGETLHVLSGHEGLVRSAVFSPDGSLVLTASRDGTARLWRTADGALEATLSHPGRSQLYHACFSPGGDRIVTCATDATAIVWDTTTRRLRTVLRGFGGAVSHFAFDPTGTWMCSSSRDQTARIHDTTGAIVATLRGHDRSVTGSTFAGGRIVTVSDDDTMRIWEITQATVPVLRGHSRGLRAAAFSPEGNRLVTISDDETTRLWTRPGESLGQPLQIHRCVGGGGSWITFAGSDQRILSASREGVARLLDLRGDRLAEFPHDRGVLCATLSPDGRHVLTSGGDRTAALWRLDGTREQTFVGHRDEIRAAFFSADGELIVTASKDRTAKAWDRAGNTLRTLRHPGMVRCARFGATKDIIVTACNDGIIRVWRDNLVLRTLSGHEGAVLWLDVSPDGSRILSMSRDRTARLWNTATGDLVYQLEGHTAIVWGGGFSHDGRYAVTASWDHTARVWSLDPEELVNLARARLIRDFTPRELKRYRELLGR
jgi:eukaryotic-like serine/threonine-protein kinase